jgi:hypothetical protein
MEVHAYLVISSSGALRVVKTRPYLNNREIALTLKLNIPSVFFDRLMPTAEITVPKEALVDIDPEVAVNIAALKVSDALKLDFVEVRDGLKEMVLQKEEHVEDKPQKSQRR